MAGKYDNIRNLPMLRKQGCVTMHEMSAETDTPEGTLRRWVAQGHLAQPKKISAGPRGMRGFWPGSEIDRVREMRKLLREGKSLIEASKLTEVRAKRAAALSEIGITAEDIQPLVNYSGETIDIKITLQLGHDAVEKIKRAIPDELEHLALVSKWRFEHVVERKLASLKG